MSPVFLSAHIKLLFALISSGDLFFPGNIDGLSNILKIISPDLAVISRLAGETLCPHSAVLL